MTDADLRNAALFAVQRLSRRFGDAIPFRAIDQAHLRREVCKACGSECTVSRRADVRYLGGPAF